MGKNDFLSPKDIANRIKAKGLQKLRWYCQLCQKQCRDENGFKCHQMSEGHRRQMEVFGQSAARVVGGFSEEFETTFLEHMRRAHPHSRIAAHYVYNEYIQDKHHIHMNATKWLTLTEFVKHLGREGLCKVEETPKGWFITLVHEDPADKLASDKRAKIARREEEDEERQARLLAEQVERARAAAGDGDAPPEGTELAVCTLPIAHAPPPPFPRSPRAARPADADAAGGAAAAAGKKRSKLEELMQRDLEAKRRRQDGGGGGGGDADGGGGGGPEPASSSGRGRVDHWLAAGVVVKVMSKALKEHGYYKQKGVVERVIDKYVGEVAILGSGDVIRVDQAELETVIPSVGGAVRVVNGRHRGNRGELLEIDTSAFAARVRLAKAPAEGREAWFEYEDVCKLA
ncbi:MAG: splicing factor-like protein [Monoraphidium minutum]|nr:MAG: splicing factor-like protein [Monoraphidium minutum]